MNFVEIGKNAIPISRTYKENVLKKLTENFIEIVLSLKANFRLLNTAEFYFQTPPPQKIGKKLVFTWANTK